MSSLFVRAADRAPWADQGPNGDGHPSKNAEMTMTKDAELIRPGATQERLGTGDSALASVRPSELLSTNARDFRRLGDLIYHIESTQTLDESNATVSMPVDMDKQ